MRMNINDRVRVRLTADGRDILAKIHQERFGYLGDRAPKFSLPKEDEAGWSEWQMWTLMQDFGPYISLGSRAPFETEIEIVETNK